MMVQRKRTYKKRAYKKRTYKRRYKRTYKRRYYKPIKKPEIHIVEWTTPEQNTQSGTIGAPFNGNYGVGKFINFTPITSNTDTDIDKIKYLINDKSIEGKKIRLKYLYIKGYIKVGAQSTDDADDFNCKLMVFRWKRNTTNASLIWTNLINNTNNINLNDPSTWTENQRLDLMYKQDWKNDIKINFYKKIKNLYRKYDDANNIIPFKMRIPLYDCVLTCDCFKDNTTGEFNANIQPSTNGLYFTLLSNKYDDNTTISYKYKLYYTDY